MCDRAAERAGRRADRVGVDPLVVAGRVGEQVHLVLGDLVPLRRAQRLPASSRTPAIPCTFIRSLHSVVRSALFNSLPDAVRGSVSANTTDFGIL